jgi:hypothetical protein
LQELEGVLLDVAEGQWFTRFDPSRHVQPIAVLPGIPACLAVDAGVGRHTAAVMFQTQQLSPHRVCFMVHDCYLAVDTYAAANAARIMELFLARFGVSPHVVFIDVAASQRTSIGPTALAEFERTFGARQIVPVHTRSVVDSLDEIDRLLDQGDLIVHPRCGHLIDAFKSYARQARQGEWSGLPALNQSPHEDMIDALRYGIQGVLPEGRRPQPQFQWVHAQRLL